MNRSALCSVGVKARGAGTALARHWPGPAWHGEGEGEGEPGITAHCGRVTKRRGSQRASCSEHIKPPVLVQM